MTSMGPLSLGPISYGPDMGDDDSLIGLPRVLVTSQGEGGKKFFFDPDDWSDLIGAPSAKAWNGKNFYVVQLRNGGERIWEGNVTTTLVGGSVYGKRASGAATDQWDVDDVIL